MTLHDPVATREALARHASLRAQCVGRRYPGPAAARMLGLLGGIFRTPAQWATIGLIIAVIGITTGEVLMVLRLANWNADFFNTLEQKSVSGLITQGWILMAIVGGLMFLQAASMDTKMRLQIALRTYMTERVSYGWMDDGRHYRLRSRNAAMYSRSAST